MRDFSKKNKEENTILGWTKPILYSESVTSTGKVEAIIARL